MFVTLFLFFVATFGMVAAGVIGYRFLVERDTLLGQVAERADGDVAWVDTSELLKTDSFSSISFWDELLARVDYVRIMKLRIAEAGLTWTVGRVTLLMLLVGSLVVAVMANLDVFPWWAVLSAGGFAGLTPYMYILHKRQRRLIKLETQFPDAMDSLARALRAGHPLGTGLQMLVLEAPEPLASEMRLIVDERGLGNSWDDSLDKLAIRVPLVEIATFVAAVKLQNRTGGKLSEALGRLSETMREAGALKGEVRAIASHGRMTGLVLTILPIIIATVMAVVNPSYLAILWGKEAGQSMVVAAGLCLLAAHFVIRKMVDIRL